jgi:hypothetical protein
MKASALADRGPANTGSSNTSRQWRNFSSQRFVPLFVTLNAKASFTFEHAFVWGWGIFHPTYVLSQ